MDSILTSVKKMLGIDEECTDFDTDIIIHINTVILILKQMGMDTAIDLITGDEETWDDLFGTKYYNFNHIKTYIYMKTRMMFDPPSGSVAEATNNVIQELEFRIKCDFDEVTE